MNAIGHQPAVAPVDVAAWPGHEDFEKMYPEGTREKRLLVCPDPAPHDFLIADHRYLFKKSFHRYPDQFWVELMAYRIGCLVGVPVPPAFAAHDSRTGECAALIEWFYGLPGARPSRYIRGGEFMKRMIPGYDIKRGEQHNVQAIRALGKASADTLRTDDWRPHWARVFVFDALIANTDRHQDNWGIVLETSAKGKVRGYWSPAFDNGTSMGYNYFEPKLTTMMADRNQMAAYLRRGTHHARWSKKDAERMQHGDFLVRFCKEFPEARLVMQGCLNFTTEALEAVILPLTGFRVPVPLGEVRAHFTVKLLSYRRDRLLEQLAAMS